MTRRWFPASFAALLTCLTAACSSRPENDAYSREPDACTPANCALDEAAIRADAMTFLTDVAARREALEASLLHTANTYARERLTSYAIGSEWEALPIFDAPTATLHVAAHTVATKGDHQTWQARTTTHAEWPDWSLDDWRAAGRVAFFGYPAQRLPMLEAVVRPGESASAQLATFGLWLADDGTLAGLVSTLYADGTEAVAATCATCHARPNPDGRLVLGAPSHLDIGSVAEPWGPGRVDVTADSVTNPVAIADLRATRVQRRLHHTGNLQNSLLALAIRVETLLITNYNGAVRPPRELTFALAVYIWSLGANLASNSVGLHQAEALRPEGARVFRARCASCHAGIWGEGEWVAVAAVGAEPLVAESPARGTGGYRVPALLGFHERPRGHEALTVSLETWLNGGSPSTRGHAELTGGPALRDDELAALTAYLSAAFPPQTSR